MADKEKYDHEQRPKRTPKPAKDAPEVAKAVADPERTIILAERHVAEDPRKTNALIARYLGKHPQEGEAPSVVAQVYMMRFRKGDRVLVCNPDPNHPDATDAMEFRGPIEASEHWNRALHNGAGGVDMTTFIGAIAKLALPMCVAQRSDLGTIELRHA